jgi:outer membrane protein assembly factor BamD (BamD/ComL family)
MAFAALNRRAPLWLLAALCLWLCAGCASIESVFEPSIPDMPSKRASAEEVERQLGLAEAEFEAGRLREVSERCLRLRQVRNLPSPLRERSEVLLERATEARVAAATRARDLRSPSASRLPRRSRAIQTVGRSRLFLAEGRPYRAFTEIRDLEAAHPGHHLQNEAAETVYQAGLDLSQAKRAWIFLFSKRAQAPGVLDYLVLQHPSYPRCDHAYYLLASLHADDRDIELAIDRLSDLLLYHPNSPYSREAELLIPTLRLSDHLRIDHDYAGLVMSERELTAWLGRVASAEQGELAERARAALFETRRRLVEADLEVAQFYRTVRRPEGTTIHAVRARQRAQLIDDAEAAERADALLAWADTGQGDAELPPEFRRTEAPATDKDAPRDAQTPTEGVVGSGP